MSKQVLLIVTSSPITAAMLETAAMDLEYQTKRLRSAEETRVYLEKNPVALVVVDQHLPDGSGTDLLLEVRDLAPMTERALIFNEDADVAQVIEALNKSRLSLILRKPLTDPRVIRKGLREALLAHKRNVRDEFRTLHHSQEADKIPTEYRYSERAQRLERLYTVGEIASSLIHQFNNILTIMNGHLELLMEDLENPKHIARAQTILRAGEDGAKLTRSVQDFVRSGAAKAEVFDLNSSIIETLKMTEPIWKSRGSCNGSPICIHAELCDIPELYGNPGEIREVLTNLILNAVDAMPQGGNLTVRTTATDAAISLDIEDSGIGMSDSVRRRIFDPFFTTKGEKGNGLGLGIVRRIVREHGGDIRVRTQLGQGTCFTVLLPLKTRSSKKARPQSSPMALA